MEPMTLSKGRKTPLYIGKYVMVMQKVEELEDFRLILVEEALALPQSLERSQQAYHSHLEGVSRVFVAEDIDSVDLCVNQTIFIPSSVINKDSSSFITYQAYSITSIGYSDIGHPSSLALESICLRDVSDHHLSPFPKGEMTTIPLSSFQTVFVLSDVCTELLQRGTRPLNSNVVISDLEQIRNRHAPIMSMLNALDESRLPLSNAQFNSLFDFFRRYQLINTSLLALLQPRKSSVTSALYDTKDVDMEIVSISNPTSPKRKAHFDTDNTEVTQLEACFLLWQTVSTDCILTVIELLPSSQPVLSIRDFAALNTLIIACEDTFDQIYSFMQSDSVRDIWFRFCALRQEWCQEIISAPDILTAFTTNTARQEWKSNSPYMRNKRFSPGIVHFLSTVRETWWYIRRFAEVEARLAMRDCNDFRPSIIANPLGLIFRMLGISLCEVIKIFSWIICSRTRVTQWQFDIQYVTYTAINTLLSLDQFIRTITSSESECIAVYELLQHDLRRVYLSIWLLEIMLYLSKHNDPLQVQSLLQMLNSDVKDSSEVRWTLLQSELQASFVWRQQVEVVDSNSLQQPSSYVATVQYPFAADTIALVGLAPFMSFACCSQTEKDLFQKELGANAENSLIAAREVLFRRITSRLAVDFTRSNENNLMIVTAVVCFGRDLIGNRQSCFLDLFKLHRVEMIDNEYPPLTAEQETFRQAFIFKV